MIEHLNRPSPTADSATTPDPDRHAPWVPRIWRRVDEVREESRTDVRLLQGVGVLLAVGIGGSLALHVIEAVAIAWLLGVS